jgi:membrane-associated phospholipid phosphatase
MRPDDGHALVRGERPILVLTGLALFAGILGAAATAIGPVRELVVRIDLAWLDAAIATERAALVAVAEALAVLGSVYVTMPLRIAVSAVFVARRQWWKLAAWLLAIAASEFATTAMKALYARERPHLTLEVAPSAAFPSGHAAAAAVTAITLVLLCTRPGPRRWRWSAVAALVVVAMAASRVYLRVHWLSDVVMGTLVGATAGLVAVGVTTVVAEHRRRSRVHEVPAAAGDGELDDVA